MKTVEKQYLYNLLECGVKKCGSSIYWLMDL